MGGWLVFQENGIEWEKENICLMQPRGIYEKCVHIQYSFVFVLQTPLNTQTILITPISVLMAVRIYFTSVIKVRGIHTD